MVVGVSAVCNPSVVVNSISLSLDCVVSVVDGVPVAVSETVVEDVEEVMVLTSVSDEMLVVVPVDVPLGSDVVSLSPASVVTSGDKDDVILMLDSGTDALVVACVVASDVTNPGVEDEALGVTASGIVLDMLEEVLSEDVSVDTVPKVVSVGVTEAVDS